jgi:hypothetical protein
MGGLCAVGTFLLAGLNDAADTQAAAFTLLLAFPLVGALVAPATPATWSAGC